MNSQTLILNDAELDAASGGWLESLGGSELIMISLESVVSKRATVLQLTSGMLQAMRDSAKTAASNIGH